MWLGGGDSPQASFLEFYLQQRTSDLPVKHITEANKLLKHLNQLTATLRYRKRDEGGRMDVLKFADAYFNITAGLEYGQTGFIVGVTIESPEGPFYHLMDWMSRKQRRISHSSYGTEILVCADGDGRGLHINN